MKTIAPITIVQQIPVGRIARACNLSRTDLADSLKHGAKAYGFISSFSQHLRWPILGRTYPLRTEVKWKGTSGYFHLNDDSLLDAAVRSLSQRVRFDLACHTGVGRKHANQAEFCKILNLAKVWIICDIAKEGRWYWHLVDTKYLIEEVINKGALTARGWSRLEFYDFWKTLVPKKFVWDEKARKLVRIKKTPV